MQLLVFLGYLFFVGLAFGVEDEEKLSDVDRCIAAMQQQLRHKNMTRTLGGLVGMGWDDLTNKYTLPVYRVTYKDCQVDPDNTYLVPDNILLIPIKKTALDKTSSVFNSYDEFKTLSSDKLTISGSASAKGKGKASGSFSRETTDTKDQFVKQNSIMIQNKLRYMAYELIGNENGGLDESFIERVKEIAKAVDEKQNLKAQFLAETLIANYGTHVIHKATAAAEIVQNVFVKKVEEFKGEKHMTEIKAGLAAEFDGQAYGGGGEIGVENKEESEKNETKTTEHTKVTIVNRGGPNINRVGSSNLTEAMLYVDNLIGINQIGKFLYDIIPAVPMPEYSRMTKYTVKNLVYEAIQEYYKYNTLPGCMEFDSANYNPLANFEDGSCVDPGILYTFGGVYQACTPIQSWADQYEMDFGTQCEKYVINNRVTGGMSCPNGTAPVLIDFMKVQFLDRTIEMPKRKCWKFIPYCWYEMVNITIWDEIYVPTYWCMGEIKLNNTNFGQAPPNELDMIMRHQILNAIEGKTDLLKIFFPTSFDFKEQMKNQTVCEPNPDDENSSDKITWKSVIEDFIEAGARRYCRGCRGPLLNITKKQLDMLSFYPKTLEALLPILDIGDIRDGKIHNHRALATNPICLQQKLFNQSQTLLNQEEKIYAYFGGMFHNNNNNALTGTPGCPSFFEEVNILQGLKMCVCYETDRKWSIRLGKLFHCYSKDKSCPKGYSKFLAGNVNNCEYNYCIRFHTRDDLMKPVLSKPPYIKYEYPLPSEN